MFVRNSAFIPDDKVSNREAIARMPHFNLWLRPTKPFDEFEEGERLVYADRKRGLLWLCEVGRVLKADFDSRDEAVAIMAAAMDWSEEDIRTDGYFIGRAIDAGVLLAFRPRPIQRLGGSLPFGFRFLGNGWASVPERDEAAFLAG